ncbi:hypothetical protein C5F47_04480 [Nitrosopumilus cobalaminigenes]|uniref:Type IV pilin n=1 Tax=Nitrosopumilus cobalaminigenes TaxID=1470066 RepID=A0A7D5R027_9ARCH|nr:hypothetical protein [Nitrosopumilus cobalaminigenes]QLH02858.1 hypothetical protein C5F47_04480 [Nitrosopumilus cobalaminigenes]
MKTKLSKKRAISTVLTTVIILVSSVVLGSGVVLYGTSLFQGGTQSEAISVSGVKMWVHGTASDGLAWGAAKIRNTGDKVLSVDKISVRGSDVPFSQWYADTSINATTFQLALNFTGWSGTAGNLVDDTTCTTSSTVEIGLSSEKTDASSICANAATGPIGLSPGESGVIYFKLTNGTLTSLDSGAQTTVNIFAGKAGAPQSVTVSGVTNTG